VVVLGTDQCGIPQLLQLLQILGSLPGGRLPPSLRNKGVQHLNIPDKRLYEEGRLRDRGIKSKLRIKKKIYHQVEQEVIREEGIDE
jgi:hypothetical protein